MVPTHNHALYIAKCLRSIIGQTLQPKKLLVIDDGSSDGSPAVIASVLENCPFESELIVRANRGLCATLNEGLSISSGKYFAYIGSDDFWLPTFLEERSRLMENRENAVLGYGHAFLIDESDNIIDRTEDYREDWANYPDGNPREMLLKGVSPVSSTVFYRLSALENVSWNETSRLEDYEMYLTLMNLGDFAFDPRTLSVWRQHGTNTSKDLSMMHYEVMDAQRRHVDGFGITEDELLKVQKRIKFRYARELLQSGEKDAAIRLLRESWTAARSPVAVAKSIAQLLMPKPTLVKYQEKKRAMRVNKNRDQKI